MPLPKHGAAMRQMTAGPHKQMLRTGTVPLGQPLLCPTHAARARCGYRERTLGH